MRRNAVFHLTIQPTGTMLTTLTFLSPALLPGAAIAVLLYAIGLTVYRRYFHPLAKVPGPLLASITTLYQSYYNGYYYLKIADLHREYGMQGLPAFTAMFLTQNQVLLFASLQTRSISATRKTTTKSTMSAPAFGRPPFSTALSAFRTAPLARQPMKCTSTSAA